jgi:LysM repeat protein
VSRRGLAIALLVCAALGLGITARPRAAAAAGDAITHRVKEGDTLDLLAAEYYGDRRHAIFLMVANGMEHPRPLKKGEKLKVPVSRDVTAAVGDTLGSLAATYLGDERRAPFLGEFNSMAPDESIAAGQTLSVPFHVTHRAAGHESLADIAAAYFADPRQGALLKAYNFLDKDALEQGETIDVPIFHVRVRSGKLPGPDAESRARTEKRRLTQERAQAALPGARAAWDDGDYQAVKRELTPIDTDYLDTRLAVEIGVMLGSAYVAFGDEDSALATFKRALERKPKHGLSGYAYSPKIRAVWQKAGGAVATP